MLIIREYSKKIISLILAIVIILGTFIPNVTFAEYPLSLNGSETDDNLKFFNGETIILELDGEFCTEVKKGNDIIIKSYTNKGKLIEEVKVIYNSNKIESTIYDKVGNNFPKKETILIEKDSSISQEIQKSNSTLAVAPIKYLGTATFSSKSQPYYRGMEVRHRLEVDNISFTVPSAANTLAQLTATIISATLWPSIIAGRVIVGFVAGQIIKKIGEKYVFNTFKVAAIKRDSTTWGKDQKNSSYSNFVKGTNYEVSTKSSKYYKEQHYQGIFLDATYWGSGQISRALGPSVYNSFYSTLTYVSEGR